MLLLKSARPALLAAWLVASLTAPARAEDPPTQPDPVLLDENPAAEKPEKAVPRPLKRLSDPYARLPAVQIVPGAPVAAPTVIPENRNALVLPKMTVKGRKEKVPSLPRIFVQPPARNVPEPDDPSMETPAARNARLVQKHITSVDRVLNQHPLPLVGGSLVAKAKAAEAREVSAKQLNNIADLLELSALAGLDDPAEQKKLRAEYLNALADRPR